MARLMIHVEGETEETFVNEVLSPHLRNVGFVDVSARIVGNARLREQRGGIKGWHVVRQDIVRHLRGDVDCYATTMVDYYALPRTGEKAWPGRENAPKLPFTQRAQHVQEALETDVRQAMGDDF